MQALKSYKMPELSFLCIYLHFCRYSPGLSPCCVWIMAVWLRITYCFFCKTVSFGALGEQHSVIERLHSIFVLPPHFSAWPMDTFTSCYSNLSIWQNHRCLWDIFLWCYSLKILFMQYFCGMRGDVICILYVGEDRLRLKFAFNLGSKSEAPKMIYFVEYLVQWLI